MKIIFEFFGGPLDGKSVVGRTGEQDEADRYYVLSHHGRLGQRFKVASSYAVGLLSEPREDSAAPRRVQQHHYRVTDRLEGEQEVLVRAEYVPSDEQGNPT